MKPKKCGNFKQKNVTSLFVMPSFTFRGIMCRWVHDDSFGAAGKWKDRWTTDFHSFSFKYCEHIELECRLSMPKQRGLSLAFQLLIELVSFFDNFVQNFRNWNIADYFKTASKLNLCVFAILFDSIGIPSSFLYWKSIRFQCVVFFIIFYLFVCLLLLRYVEFD